MDENWPSGQRKVNPKTLSEIQGRDHGTLMRKEETYQGSWKKRGGVGAFMMLARKWDRLENMAKAHGYDIFAAMCSDTDGDESVAETIRDLRCYLLLVEEETGDF